jgi:hypothetical protein
MNVLNKNLNSFIGKEEKYAYSGTCPSKDLISVMVANK